jgi:putative membrane protein
MIVRPRLHWLRMLLVWRGSVLPEIAPQLLFTTAFAGVVVALHGRVFQTKIALTFVPFTLVGLTLAIFLGFRNSTSYARYWEARQLWGSLLNDARSLARQAVTLVDDPTRAPEFVHCVIAFTHALRHQLRGTDPSADFARLLPTAACERLSASRCKAAVLLVMAGEWLRERRQQGQLSPVLVPAMEAHLGRLCEVLGGCERIASTPIPFTYGVIIHRTIHLYCLLLPFGLVDSIGLMTPLVVAFVAYTFFALEALSAQIEEPFGTEANDLALNAMAWAIEATLRETLGEQDLPAVPAPVDYILT